MTPPSAVYEERYRLTWPAAVAGVIDGGFVALVLVFRFPLLLRVVTIGVFGWLAVVTAVAVLLRRVAFRADAAGLTLAGSPFRYRSTTRIFPWPELQAVTVWKRDVLFFGLGRFRSPRLRLRYVGVRRLAGTAPLAGRVANVRVLAFAPGAATPPGVLAGTARVVSVWRLDDRKLAAAMSAFAPNVKLTLLH